MCRVTMLFKKSNTCNIKFLHVSCRMEIYIYVCNWLCGRNSNFSCALYFVKFTSTGVIDAIERVQLRYLKMLLGV